MSCKRKAKTTSKKKKAKPKTRAKEKAKKSKKTAKKKKVKAKRKKAKPKLKAKAFKENGGKLKKNRIFSSELISLLSSHEVRSLLISTAGENAIAVLRELANHGEDEKIANNLGVKVSDVRAVLNKLHSEGFVFYERTRDEKSGWYYYDWTIDLEKMKHWVEEKLNYKRKLFFELSSGGERYFCSKCGLESIYSFEEAMDFSFKCPSCNSSLELLDEEKLKKLLNLKIRK